jgi:hypothetical protein
MPNMSYCRFENTYRDLLDCLDNMNEQLSKSEAGYKESLVDVCREIIDEYELNKMSDNVWGDDEWGFDIVELERDGEDKDNSNTQNTQNEYDGESWDMQSK